VRDSSSLPSSTSWPGSELPQPADDPNLSRTFAGYKAALRSMSIPQLMSQANQLAAAIELEQRQLMNQLISERLSGSLDSLDRLQTRSPRTAYPSREPDSADRGQARSRPSPPPKPSAVDLLASSQRLAPRIAAKLVLAEAQRARAERG
jgi:hypothetical protein